MNGAPEIRELKPKARGGRVHPGCCDKTRMGEVICWHV